MPTNDQLAGASKLKPNYQRWNMIISSVYTGDKTLNVVAVTNDGDLKRWEDFYWNRIARRKCQTHIACVNEPLTKGLNVKPFKVSLFQHKINPTQTLTYHYNNCYDDYYDHFWILTRSLISKAFFGLFLMLFVLQKIGWLGSNALAYFAHFSMTEFFCKIWPGYLTLNWCPNLWPHSKHFIFFATHKWAE
jgi:hypothetical protein